MSRTVQPGEARYDLDGVRTDFPIPFDVYDAENLQAGELSPYVRVYRVDTTNEAIDVTNLATMPDVSTIRIEPAIGQSGETLLITSNPLGIGTVAPLGRWDTTIEDGTNLSAEELGKAIKQLQLYCESLTDSFVRWVEGNGEDRQDSIDYVFSGDGVADTFSLDGINKDLSNGSVFVYYNGAALHPTDFTMQQNGTTGVAELVFASPPPSGTDIFVRVANQNNLAANLNPGDVGTNEIADGSVTIEKLNISGNPFYVLGLDDVGDFGLQELTPLFISGLSAFVQSTRLDQFAPPDNSLDLNAQRITNLATPTNANDAANKAYVDATAQSGWGPWIEITDTVRDEWYVPSQTTETFVAWSGRSCLIEWAEDAAGTGSLPMYFMDNSADDTTGSLHLNPGEAWRVVNGNVRYVRYKFKL